VRGIVYFDGAKVLVPSLVMVGYALVGAVVLLIVAAARTPAHRKRAAG
jgi:hypothetical protein